MGLSRCAAVLTIDFWLFWVDLRRFGVVKLTSNISAIEVLPQSVWEKWGRGAVRLMDPRIVQANQKIRDRFGRPRYFNTWGVQHWSDRDESGLRVPGHTYYNELSQHTYGRGLDSISDTISHEEVWADVLEHPEWYWDAGVTVIESINVADSWLHTDSRGYGYGGRALDELMIADKIDGAWQLIPAGKYGKL